MLSARLSSQVRSLSAANRAISRLPGVQRASHRTMASLTVYVKGDPATTTGNEKA